MLIWDDEKPFPKSPLIILWSDYECRERHTIISVPTFVDENSDYYKKKYLDWIYEFGEYRINNKSIVDHLEIKPGLSYWWLSSLAQKFNFSDNSEINNAIKLFALEDLVKKYNPDKIALKTKNYSLFLSVKKFSNDLNIEFEVFDEIIPSRNSPFFSLITFSAFSINVRTSPIPSILDAILSA